VTPAAQMIRFIDVMAVVAERPAPVILIVDSEPDLRMAAVQFVKEEGFETLEAGDADQAIAILECRSHSPASASSVIRPVGWNSRIVVQNRV
jgi:PleD family two-component response regulator